MPDATLIWVAALLSLERITYVVVWRAPDAFRRWTAQHVPARLGGPVETLAALFAAFKVLQVAVFLAWCLEHGQGHLAPHSLDTGTLAIGALLITAGQTLNLSVFRTLGKVGVFYGNRLGYEVPWRRTFPFTWFDHPQYVGTVLSIWGFFVLMRFPAPDWAIVPVLETLYYAAGAHFERDDVSSDEAYARAKE